MRLEVDYIDPQGNQTIVYLNFSRLAFIKHMAIAGQKYQPKWKNAKRLVGMFFLFQDYFQQSGFNNRRFTKPSVSGYDPTEQGQFSTLAGKAIADFVAKRLNNSCGTYSYEAAMKIAGFPIRGTHPDLIADTPDKQSFAIEAKGRSENTVDMVGYKRQASSGPIKVSFSVAAVSYNIYSEIKCNYHDPLNENVEYNYKLFRELSKQYYSGLFEYMNSSTFIISEINLNKEKFFKLNFRFSPNPLVENFYRSYFNTHKFPESFEEYITRFYFLLPGDIQAFSNSGLPTNYRPFRDETSNGKVYIDNDRVGVGFD